MPMVGVAPVTRRSVDRLYLRRQYRFYTMFKRGAANAFLRKARRTIQPDLLEFWLVSRQSIDRVQSSTPGRRERSDRSGRHRFSQEIEKLGNGRGIVPDIVWSPDNQRLLFAMKPPSSPFTQLYYLDRAQPSSPQLWPRQPADMQCFDFDWSCDGSKSYS